MCLYITKGQEPKIAEKAIRVYKVLKQYGVNNYLTPFQSYCVSPGHKATSELIVEPEDDYTPVIDIGLHSFRTLKSARMCKSNQYGVPVIIRCTIPKGATYYLGRFYYDDDSYASNELLYPKTFEPCV